MLKFAAQAVIIGSIRVLSKQKHEENRKEFKQYYPTPSDLDNDLKKITKVSKEVFDGVYLGYTSEAHLRNYIELHDATTDLIKDIERCKASPEKIAAHIRNYLLAPVNHELSFCLELIRHMATLQSGSLDSDLSDEMAVSATSQSSKSHGSKRLASNALGNSSALLFSSPSKKVEPQEPPKPSK